MEWSSALPVHSSILLQTSKMSHIDKNMDFLFVFIDMGTRHYLHVFSLHTFIVLFNFS